MAQIILEFCSNPECNRPLTIDNWPEGGTWDGYPLCPECFRFHEGAEFYRKEVIAERGEWGL